MKNLWKIIEQILFRMSDKFKDKIKFCVDIDGTLCSLVKDRRLF